MFRNEPLMFVQGPPVYIKVTIKDEESTSVFVTNEDESQVVAQDGLEEIEQQVIQEVQEEQPLQKMPDPSIIRRINYLGSPFARQVYRPLQFVMGEEKVKGTIEKIEGETLIIEMAEGEKEFVAIEMGRIEEILWRGNPFVES